MYEVMKWLMSCGEVAHVNNLKNYLGRIYFLRKFLNFLAVTKKNTRFRMRNEWHLPEKFVSKGLTHKIKKGKGVQE